MHGGWRKFYQWLSGSCKVTEKDKIARKSLLQIPMSSIASFSDENDKDQKKEQILVRIC